MHHASSKKRCSAWRSSRAAVSVAAPDARAAVPARETKLISLLRRGRLKPLKWMKGSGGGESLK